MSTRIETTVGLGRFAIWPADILMLNVLGSFSAWPWLVHVRRLEVGPTFTFLLKSRRRS